MFFVIFAFMSCSSPKSLEYRDYRNLESKSLDLIILRSVWILNISIRIILECNFEIPILIYLLMENYSVIVLRIP